MKNTESIAFAEKIAGIQTDLIGLNGLLHGVEELIVREGKDNGNVPDAMHGATVYLRMVLDQLDRALTVS